MYPYQHSPSSGTSSSGPGPSTSQQFLGNVESAASRLKRAFGKKRSTRLGEEEGTQSDAPSSRKLLPGPRLSSLLPRKDPKQFASTFQSIGQRLNKSSSPRVVSYIEAPKEPTSPRHPTPTNDAKPFPSSPLKVPSTPKSAHRSSHLVPTSEISAAIDYMMDSTSSLNSPSSPPKADLQADQVMPRTTRAARSGSFDAENASPTKSTKRRSMSLSMIPVFGQPNEIQHVQATSTPPSSFSLSSKLSPSVYQPHHRSHSEIPSFPDSGSTSSLSAATPVTSTHSNSDTPRDKPSSSNLKDRLTAWAAPPNQPRTSRGSSPGHTKTMSMVASLAPAANAATGLAVSFSKKAYEKVNSIWTPTTSHSPPESNLHSAQPSEVSDSSLRGRRLHGYLSAYGGSQSDVEGSKRRTNPLINDQPPAPNLGPMLRPPFRNSSQGGGLLFGRPLVDCVRDTKALVVLGPEPDAGLEARFIPALVLRCVQHIERWGIVEEGLFRIAGRTSHINKIRSEFASGADYDLQSCGPGDLDPHAVSSVLKAFVRELPEPILTREMSPLFDAAFERAKESGFMLAGLPSPRTINHQMGGHHGFPRGLPSNPRPVQAGIPQLPSSDTTLDQDRKPEEVPSESRVAPEEALQTLLSEFRHLASSLAQENQDLLLTMTELLDKVASYHKTTKMPLSNLLLVLCPSMNMNPGVLKILVEHHRAIFFGHDETNPVSSTGVMDLQHDQNLQPAGLHDASSYQESPKGEVQHETASSPPLDGITSPIPANKLPVRKQSLRKHDINLSQARATPSSSPSAFKDTTQVQTMDTLGSEVNLSQSAPSNQTSILHGEMVRPPQPVGPRHPKVVPAPIKVRRHSLSLSRDAPISSNQVLEHLPDPPATAPPVSQIYPIQHPILSDGVTLELSASQLGSNQAVAVDSPPLSASRQSMTPWQEPADAIPPPKELTAPTTESIGAAALETPLPTVYVPSIEISAPSVEHNAPRLLTDELHTINSDSAVSSATTELPTLEQLDAWPKVPKTEPSITDPTQLGTRNHHNDVDDASPIGNRMDEETPISPARSVDSGGQEVRVQFSDAVLEDPTLEGQDLAIATSKNHIVQRQASNTPLNRRTSLNGGEENIVDAAKQSPATAREATQASESKTTRPLQFHAPRLTVNSKEMLSSDSYWAKELQRAIQSTPGSPIDGRHSGEWANSVLNTAGL